MKIMSIAGARPNFMKIASLSNAITSHNEKLRSGTVSSKGKSISNKSLIEHIIVHTGQHYDDKMSENFFTDLEIPKPDINLGVGSGSHAFQSSEIMKKFESVLLREEPNIIIVVGDVNSTIACALVAVKIEYNSWKTDNQGQRRPVIVHVEAGLRSFDRDMPEEINRILTDAISDILFVTEPEALKNLSNEGVAQDRVHLVGNVMIDTLQKNLRTSENSKIKEEYNIDLSRYGVVTLHRPSNVDHFESLKSIIHCLEKISYHTSLIFPVHPRTKSNLEKFDLWTSINSISNVHCLPPLGYLDFLYLVKNSCLVITDSGGIQEETTYLKIPCVTLRNNTERPITVTEGSNYLVGTEQHNILNTVKQIVDGNGEKESKVPDLWDGKAGERIIDLLASTFINR